MLTSIENDPYDLESKDPYKAREMDKFQKSQRTPGINMVVVMFMVDALQYFEKHSPAEVRKIAVEIAMLGTQGIRPDTDGHRIDSIPGKSFSVFIFWHTITSVWLWLYLICFHN